MVLSALQTVHGAVQDSKGTPLEENEEGNKILMIFGVVMMLVGIVLVKMLEKGRRCIKSRRSEQLNMSEEGRNVSTSATPTPQPTATVMVSRLSVESQASGVSGSTSTPPRPLSSTSREATSRDPRGDDVEEPHEEPPSSLTMVAQPKVYSGRRRAMRPCTTGAGGLLCTEWKAIPQGERLPRPSKRQRDRGHCDLPGLPAPDARPEAVQPDPVAVSRWS